MRDILTGGLAALGLGGTVPADAPEKLSRYAALLLERNKVMNLTAITDPADVAVLHMLDSAALLPLLPEGPCSLIDVGTGAGFPGLVLAALRPDIHVTLLDAQEKRLRFLDETAEALSLPNAATLHGRAEDTGRDPAYRERFDCAAARAVAELRVLAELCLPLVRVGGRFLAMKGPDPAEEVEAARSVIAGLGGGEIAVHPRALPGGVTHSVVVVEKAAPTPERYPRKWKKIKAGSE